MNTLDFYVQITKALDEINAPYMIVGAFAGLSFGLTRSTFDIDILVDLHEPHIRALALRFPGPRYYADPEMMRNSMRDGIMFNIIDSTLGVKADLVPLTREPNYRVAFARRIRRRFQDGAGNSFEAWCAQPTDVIIGKLQAWAEGRSAKHPSDIYDMLLFDLSGQSSVKIDLETISIQAALLGLDVLALWKELLARAQTEVKKHNDKNAN